MDSKVNIRFTVTPMSSPQNKKGKLKVKIEGSRPDAIAKHYELTGGGNNDTNLLNAINKVVAKCHSFTADYSMHRTPDDLIEAIGTDVFNKQAQNNLKEVDLNIVRELYLLLKVARKIHSSYSDSITYSMFNNFKRTNRYNYGNDKTLTGGISPKKTDGRLKTETAWTSYFKDVLAYESTRDGGKIFDENKMFKNIEIKNVESVSGMPEGGGNSSARNMGNRRNGLGGLNGNPGSSDSGCPESDDESVNSDLRSTGGQESLNKKLESFIDTHKKKIEQKEAAIKIQCAFRSFQAKSVLREKREQKEASAVRIQAVGRRFSARTVYSAQKEGVVKIQGLVRGIKVREATKKQKSGVVKLQALLRGRSVRNANIVQKQQKGAIKIQCAFRSFQAKSVLRKKREQKEADAAKKQIENRIFMQRAFKIWGEVVKAARQPVTPFAYEGVRSLNRVTSTSHSLQVDLGQQSIRSSSSNSIKRATQNDNAFCYNSDYDDSELGSGLDEGGYSSFSEEEDGGINSCDIEMSLIDSSKERNISGQNGQPTLPVRSDVKADPHQTGTPRRAPNPSQSPISVAQIGSPSTQSDFFGNPFANGGYNTPSLHTKVKGTQSNQVSKGKLLESSSEPNLGSQIWLASGKNNRRHLFSASPDKSEWGSAEKIEMQK